MIVDASVLCAIILDEPDSRTLALALSKAPTSAITPIQVWEACVAISQRLQSDQSALVLRALREAGTEVAPIGGDEALLAFDAWRRFGKGRHPAGLNLGDCFAYALAKSRGLPLLYKGDDFSKTDVRPAI